jgi:class 3 adenylate cyclase
MRVERAFAFVDLCGFTAFTATEGDEMATAVLAQFRACLREIASRRGVRVAKWLGDGAMLVSVEPEPVVSAILEIEQRIDDGRSALPIRAGMSMGRVILFEGDDYIGTPVNLAARLCDVASPRQIVAVPTLAAHCPPWAVADEVVHVPVPGFTEPVELVRIRRRPPGARPVTDPVCGMVISAEAAAAWANGEAGVTWAFCSAACFAAWEDTHPVSADA